MRYPTIALAAAIGALAVAGPGQAGAATRIGETFPPDYVCDSGSTIVQSDSLDQQFAAPSAGVITAWSHQAVGSPPAARLKVARPGGGDDFTIVGESALETLGPGVVNTFPTRIAVRAGDVIGFYFAPAGYVACARVRPGYEDHFLAGDQPAGTTAAFTPQSGYELDVSAVLEPDADTDGFGDETQDTCPGQPGATHGCPPETTINNAPKKTTAKKKARFAFSSNVPGASFECSLDGEAFAPCSSPETVKVKRGKHSFEVRAKDQAGYVDGSPASDNWKVKRKRKRN
ncbi:MAG TPA: hypothetical protein VEK39_00080 [Solirubrobacterales bacterium]|nr:hypothetical protein [Solirubrobacterales bacterium]